MAVARVKCTKSQISFNLQSKHNIMQVVPKAKESKVFPFYFHFLSFFFCENALNAQTFAVLISSGFPGYANKKPFPKFMLKVQEKI